VFRRVLSHGWFTTLVLVGAVLAVVAIGEATCPFPPSARVVNDPYDFVRALVDSLGRAHEASRRITGNEENVALVLRIKQARGDYSCAAAEMKGFDGAHDTFIARPARLVLGVYTAVVQLHEHVVSDITTFLNEAARGQGAPGRATDRVTDFIVGRDDMLRMLMQASAMSMYALVEWSKEGDQKVTGRLRITEAKRLALMRNIENTFGAENVRQGMKPGQQFAEGSAAAVYSFLADRKWRSADGLSR
jgi:hypothetical protein